MTPTPEEVEQVLKSWRATLALPPTGDAYVHVARSGIERLVAALAASQKDSEEYARLWHRDADRVRELEMKDEAWESTMREIANSGVEFEDERVGYVTVQIDRDIWLSLAALRGPSTAGATGEQGLEERT